MQRTDAFLTLATMGSAGLMVTALLYRNAAVQDFREHERVLLSAALDRIEATKPAEAYEPPNISPPEWMHIDPRSNDSVARVARLSQQASVTPQLEFVQSERDSLVLNLVNRSLLATTPVDYKHIARDPVDWSQSIRARLSSLAVRNRMCPIFEFGQNRPVGWTTEHLDQALERFLSLESRGERMVAGASISAMLSEYEAMFAEARPMPVVNGEARGTLPARGTAVRFCEPEHPLPRTSTLYTKAAGRCGFNLHTRPGTSHCFLRLISNEGDVWRGFVRAGDSISVDLPRGDYTLRYATGERWFGSEYLFGPGTTFSEMGGIIDLRSGFRTTIELVPQLHGNLTEREIDANGF
jgi:hypothetical protein